MSGGQSAGFAVAVYWPPVVGPACWVGLDLLKSVFAVNKAFNVGVKLRIQRPHRV